MKLLFLISALLICQTVVSKGIYPTWDTTLSLSEIKFSTVPNTNVSIFDVENNVRIQQQTYRSPPMRLGEGEVVFTDPKRTPLTMPKGNIAITSFHAEVVDEEGRSVPLSEVYNHHWLVFNGKGNAGVCGGYLSYVFGVGAESRGTTTTYPHPYALVLKGDEKWGANIHLLRTVNIKNIKNCIECGYTPEKPCPPELTVSESIHIHINSSVNIHTPCIISFHVLSH